MGTLILTIIGFIVGGLWGIWGAEKFDKWYIGLPISIVLATITQLSIGVVFILLGWI